MTRTTCEHCGNPKVNVSWDEEAEIWTGICMECRSIINATKDEVVFL